MNHKYQVIQSFENANQDYDIETNVSDICALPTLLITEQS